MLTPKQQETYDYFMDTINKKHQSFLPSDERGVGKTYILNELGFELQALGYQVYIMTPHHDEHVACKYINNINELNGVDKNKVVIFVDEVRFYNDKNQEFFDYCWQRGMPVVGFVDYSKSVKVK